ncbi:MAG: universal stress protein [Deltaproteobacteria bacterium]|nr:universal stress protein [Deltaproteobacteria bacterium]
MAACLDGSAIAELVLCHAAAVADAYEAKVTIVRVLEAPARSGCAPADPLSWEVSRLEAGAYLERIAGQVRSGDETVELETRLLEGDPAVQACHWIEANGVDLTVICTHGEKGRTEWPLGSTARKLVEGARCSLLVVPASAAPPAARVRYQRILVPMDGSVWSESVLPVAMHLAEAHGAEVVLAHAVPSAELTRIGPLSPDDIALGKRLLERNERVAREYLEHLRARLSAAGLSVRVALASGESARSELLRLIAEENPDLITMSSCGSSAHAETPFGTIAAHLLAYAGKPLLLIRAEQRSQRSYRDDHVAAAPRFCTQAIM